MDTSGAVEPRERFERLYAEHAGSVLGYARRRCDPGIADDVVADVFLIAWRRLEDVPADPLPWLLGTARRVLANHRRSLGRWLALRERARVEAAGSTSSLEPASPDGSVLHALAALRPVDREALLLVAWDGLEPSRAAQALGMRPGAFAVRLHRARRRFAAALAAEERRQGLGHSVTTRMEVSS